MNVAMSKLNSICLFIVLNLESDLAEEIDILELDAVSHVD
jgi:hypothetical protein